MKNQMIGRVSVDLCVQYRDIHCIIRLKLLQPGNQSYPKHMQTVHYGRVRIVRYL